MTGTFPVALFGTASNASSPSPVQPPYPMPEHEDIKAILTIVFAALSLLACSFVVSLYVRYRAILRRPILDSLVMAMACSIPASVNLIIGASLRFTSNSLHGYCMLNAYFFQQFNLVEIMMEGTFFGAMGWTLSGGSVTYIGVRRAFALFLIVGALCAVIPIAALNTNPLTGTVFGSEVPWCWLPEFDEVVDGKWRASDMLTAFKFFFGYFYPVLTTIAGLGTTVVMIRRSRRAAGSIHRAIFWRLIYVAVFAVFWFTCLVPRIFADQLPESDLSRLQFVLAVVPPGMPLLNAILFVVLEDVFGTLRQAAINEANTGTAACISAYDRMAFVDIDDDTVLIDYVDDCARGDGVSERFSSPSSRNLLVNAQPPPEKPDASTSLSPRTAVQLQLSATETAIHSIQRAEQQAEDANNSSHFRATYDEDAQVWVVEVTASNFAAGSDQDVAQRAALKAFEDSVGGSAFVERVSGLAKPPLCVALAFLAGYCDAIGFIAINLFTSHVTGNIVLIGVHISNKKDVDTAEIWPNLAAIPTFMVFIGIVYSLIPTAKHHHRRVLLTAECILLLFSFINGYQFGPFQPNNTHTVAAYACGLTMVAGMAVQNSYQRTHLVGLPLTTFMTGNTNQTVHDAVELFKRIVLSRDPAVKTKEALKPIWTKFKNNSMTVSCFFCGAMLSSLVYRAWEMWAFLPPPLLAFAYLVIFWEETAMPIKKQA
jgi:uncharacterized membrane protein YoaK (UPF0700 family)